MSGFEVTVYTRVKETYCVDAESAEQAREIWHRRDPESSECIEVEDVTVEEAEHDQ